jgi:Rrf2 family transcriptional regulator, cysteine metabolism repressor
MKLSTKSEYACLALIDLSENYNKGVTKIIEISERKKIPKKYLENILLILNRAGYLVSKKGVNGGYMLAKPPEKISIAEIIRIMDGALAPIGSVSQYFYQPSPIDQNKKLLLAFPPFH